MSRKRAIATASPRGTPPPRGLDLSPPSAWHSLDRPQYARWLARATLAEFVGTFVMIYTQAAAGDAMIRGGFAAFGTADILGHGAAAFVAVFCTIHISGAIFNPALSLGLWLSQRLDALMTLAFMCAQVAGSIAAGAVLYGTTRSLPGSMVGVPQLNADIPLWRGVGLEIVWGAILFWITATLFLRGRYYWYKSRYTFHKGGEPLSGVEAGLASCLWSVAVEAGFVNTMGAAPNPARWLGPAIFSGQYANWQVWTLGPLIGVLAGALCYSLDAAYLRPYRAPIELSHRAELAVDQRWRQGGSSYRPPLPPGLPKLVVSGADPGL